MATGGPTNVGLWNVVTGQKVATLQGDRDGANMGADFGVVRIWDARPLTSGRKIDEQALGLFTMEASKGGPAAEIARKVRELGTIEEPVRLRALAITDHYEAAKKAKEVEEIVGPLFEKDHMRDEVQKELREQTGLTDDLRNRALVLSERYRVDLNTLMNYAWLMVLNSGPEAAPAYPKALKMAEEACRNIPTTGAR